MGDIKNSFEFLQEMRERIEKIEEDILLKKLKLENNSAQEKTE